MSTRAAEILETAISMIDEHGIDGVTARLIAKKLDIPSSSVFYYFPTHHDLWQAAQNHVMSVAESHVLKNLQSRTKSSGREKFNAYVVGTLDWSRENPGHVKVLASSFIRARTSEELADINEQTTARGVERIYGFLTMIQSESATKKNTKRDLKVLAQFIHHTLTGATLHCAYTKLSNREFKIYSANLTDFFNDNT
jgi:AcrR family transcriptional regulator